MPRLSKLLEKLEDRLENKLGGWYERHREKLPVYVPTGIILLYFYGMFLNSVRLGIDQTFHDPEGKIESIWVFDPLRNVFAILTPTGIVTTAVMALLFCLATKKGYLWFSGYKYKRDPRGFDILQDGTHGTSGFLTEKEMRTFLELGSPQEVKGMLLGKYKQRDDDPDKYALYVAHEMRAGDNNNLLCIGAPGTGKTRGFIIPFLLGCAKRKESVFITDPKGELFERMSLYFKDSGYTVRAINYLDMEYSDGWNCLSGLDQEKRLVQTVANTIIENTSGPKEADDFWSRAELNLLMALIHYVVNLKDDRGKLLPIEQRGLGNVYDIIANKSIGEINKTLAALPPEHPARGPHGLFLKARENLWGNIVIGLGNRLAVFQDQLVDKITRNHDVDLTLPGTQPCAYFVIISAQDSAYRFLSSLFFSLAIPQLSNYAHRNGGRLPVLVNFCLDEYCNIGYMDGIADALNSIRGFNMSCQAVVQSLSQWQERYPGKQWENQLNTFDTTLYLGCNDNTSAKYISEKCGKITIGVVNHQMPLTPLFHPVYTTTRPYSQTRSNTQRDLMDQSEIQRLDERKCIALFNHRKPALLFKLTPEELPGYDKLTPCRVTDYVPEWRRREEAEEQKPKKAQAPQPKEPEPPPQPAPEAGDHADADLYEIVGLAPEAAPTEDFYGRPIGGEVSIEDVTGLGMEE